MSSQEKQEKLVSIGMPTYNRGYWIREALDSLLSQTYKNFELIISDNASTDNTAEICKEYLKKDKRIKYIRQKEKIGAEENFSFVLKESKGEYFMWASDDDIWDRKFVEKCVEKLNKDKGAIMAFTGVIAIDEKRNYLRYFFPQKFFPTDKDIYLRLKKYLLFYHHDGKANLIYGLWRRERILNNNLKKHWAADVGYVFRNLIEGNFLLVDEFLFYKRINPKFQKRNFFSKLYHGISKRVLYFFSLYLFCYFPIIINSKKIIFKNKIKLIIYIFLTIFRSFIKRYI